MQGESYSNIRVFISYSHRDASIANLIFQLLKALNVTCFLAEISFEAGDRIKGRILSEIEQATEVILLLTPNSLDSHFVTFEYGMASAFGKRIVILYDDLTLDEIHGAGVGSIASDEFMLGLLNIERYLNDLKARIEP